MGNDTEDGRTNPQPIPHASHRGAPAPNAVSAVSPPSKGDLTSWWRRFRKQERDEEKVVAAPGIFGVPLPESIRYANVAISLTNEHGESFIYGYVPIVVAKCGVFLKEKATDVEGIFRLSGSAKRIKDLQTIFNSPDRYGKGLDWTGYTVHDAANILRRYLNQLPEPIVPLGSYETFRDPLRAYRARQEQNAESQSADFSAQEHTTAVAAYQKLITELPALNRQLLLYILDLLAVFASKSDLNRMNAANLAAIFQPGIISHPDHDMAPLEYRLSQAVLIFLIENQDNFLIGMNGTAVDEQTQKDVESGAPSVKSPKTNIGRSASNASAGADSLRKYGIRRNVSVSSRHSKDRTSPNVSSPVTPSTPSYTAVNNTGSLGRSNTVPSKRSPAIGQQRFQRNAEDSSQTSTTVVTPTAERSAAFEAATEGKPAVTETIKEHPVPDAATVTLNDVPKVEPPATPTAGEPGPTQIVATPTNTKSTSRERKISSLFSKSPIFGPSPVQMSQGERQPRKLQKRQRLPGSMNESATSSAASLQNEDGFHTPLVSPSLATTSQIDPLAAAVNETSRTPIAEHPPEQLLTTPPSTRDRASSGLKPGKSPSGSLHSGTSVTDPSDFDALEDPVSRADRQKKRRHKWKFPSSDKKLDDLALAPPPPIGQMPGARNSNSSFGSSARPSRSFTLEPQTSYQAAPDSSSAGQPSVVGLSSHDSHEAQKETSNDIEKKSLFGKWRAKIQQSKEERREREAERERAKSPQRLTGDNASSRHSLSAFAHEHFSPRAKSFDKSREDVLRPVNEQPRAEQQVTQTTVIAPVPIEPAQTLKLSSAPEPAPESKSVPPASVVESATEVATVEAPVTETRTEALVQVPLAEGQGGVAGSVAEKLPSNAT